MLERVFLRQICVLREVRQAGSKNRLRGRGEEEIGPFRGPRIGVERIYIFSEESPRVMLQAIDK